jgi:hypothetical protein
MLQKHHTAADVLHHASLYRRWRQVARDARFMGMPALASQAAANAGVALRAMRRAASVHNGICVEVAC